MSNKNKRLLKTLSTCLIASALLFPTAIQAQPAEPEAAVRLTGVIRDGRVVSLTARPLTTVLRPSVKEQVLAAEDAAPSGVFLEMRDGEDAVALRTRLEDLTRVVMEHVDPENPGRIVNKEVYPSEVPFSIVVPAPPEARSVQFFRSPAIEAGVTKALPEDMGSFPLPERQDEAAGQEEGGAS